MVVLGSLSQVAGRELDRRVVEALGGADWLTTAEVGARVGKASSNTLLRALTRLARQGHVLRDPSLDESAERRTVRWALREQVALALEANGYMAQMVAQ